MHWYGWTANTLIGGAIFGMLATMLPENVDQKDSVVAHLDRAARLRAGPDLWPEILLALES